MVRTLIDIYRHLGIYSQTTFDSTFLRLTAMLGKLPDCRMSFCKGYSQGGSNADVVIADAFLKGITDGVDWDTAYEAVVSDAEGKFQ